MPTQQELREAAVRAVKETFVAALEREKLPIVAVHNPRTDQVSIRKTTGSMESIGTYAFMNIMAEVPAGPKAKTMLSNVRRVLLPVVSFHRTFWPDPIHEMGVTTRPNYDNTRATVTLFERFSNPNQFPYYGAGVKVLSVQSREYKYLHAAQEIYSGLVVAEAFGHNNKKYRYGPVISPYEDAKYAKMQRVALTKAFFGHTKRYAAQANAYQDYVRITSEKPRTAEDMNLFLVARPNLKDMMDTPTVAGIAFSLLAEKYRRSQKPLTRQQALWRLATTPPKKLLEMARKHVDPSRVMLPRHWRAFSQSHPNGWARYVMYRKKTGFGPDERARQAVVYRLLVDFWGGNMRLGNRYNRVGNDFHIVPFVSPAELASYATILHEWAKSKEFPEIVRIFMEAVVKYAANPKKHEPNEPYHNRDTRVRLLSQLLENKDKIVMDNDFRRASLARLYQYAVDNGMETKEPPESLRHGRFKIDNYPKDNAALEEGDVTLVPLRTHTDLFVEGNAMSHCLFTAWAQHVIKGRLFAYRVIQKGAHVGTATFEVTSAGEKRLHQTVHSNNRQMHDPLRGQVARMLKEAFGA